VQDYNGEQVMGILALIGSALCVWQYARIGSEVN